MKVGAGGLQVQTTHEEVASRQTQESKRLDYQPKPVNESENAAALNRNALNKTVEKNQDTAQAFNVPQHIRGREKENRRGSRQGGPGSHQDQSTTGDEPGLRDENGVPRGFTLDKYI